MTSPQSAGGAARAKALSPIERHEIASKAAKARWAGEGATAHISPAKLARLITAEVTALRTRQTNLRRLAAQALAAVNDADAVVTALEEAAGALGKIAQTAGA